MMVATRIQSLHLVTLTHDKAQTTATLPNKPCRCCTYWHRVPRRRLLLRTTQPRPK